jgi:Zn-dependent M28 family amino/carboxypeptidase
MEELLRQDVAQLASRIGERNLKRYEALCEAASFIEQSFGAAGHEAMRQSYEALGKRFTNVEVEIRGNDRGDEVFVVGAHYDTAMGSPGANDNGSSVASLLALARHFSGGFASRTLRLVAFTNEERPFLRTKRMGSRVYARRSRERGEHIVGMLSLETIGYCSDEPRSQKLSLGGVAATEDRRFPGARRQSLLTQATGSSG